MSYLSKAWEWIRWAGEAFPAVIEHYPVASAWAWPASIAATVYFMWG